MSSSRAQQFLATLLATIGLWLFCLGNVDIFPGSLQFFIQIFPLWLIVTIGALSLGNIGYHLFKFRDCPEAYQELQSQIESGKKDLLSKGLKFSK